jgi:hypothetical protein
MFLPELLVFSFLAFLFQLETQPRFNAFLTRAVAANQNQIFLSPSFLESFLLLDTRDARTNLQSGRTEEKIGNAHANRKKFRKDFRMHARFSGSVARPRVYCLL